MPGLLAMAYKRNVIAFDRAVIMIDLLGLFFSDIKPKELVLTIVNEKHVRLGDQIIPLQRLVVAKPGRMVLEIWAVVVSVPWDDLQHAYIYADKLQTFCKITPPEKTC